MQKNKTKMDCKQQWVQRNGMEHKVRKVTETQCGRDVYEDKRKQNQ